MNVLFLTSSLPRYKNDGQVPFVWEQALAWKKACPEDQIFIIAPHDILAKSEENIDGISIFRFVYWFPRKWQKLAYPAILPNIHKNPFLVFQVPFFLLSELALTVKIIKRFQIELIFAHWVMPQGLTAYIVKHLYKVPYGLKNYSSDIRVFHKLSFLGRWFARKIIKNAKVMFCENSRLQTEALNLFSQEHQNNMKNKIIPLCMGVPYSFDVPAINKSQSRSYDLSFIGRLTKKKGVHLFIEALKNLRQQGIIFKAAIAGDGEERERLKAMSKGLNIEFIGFISDKEKLNFLHKSKFCVFPSCAAKGDIEGLPVALLEALYFGKIVIASRATNIHLLPEWGIIKENVFILDDPHDIGALTELLKKLLDLTSDEIASRSIKLHNAIKKYSWDNLILRYIDPLRKQIPIA